MTLAASIELLFCGIALYAAFLSFQLSRAPGWEDLRYFSLAAIAVAVVAALYIPSTAAILSDEGGLLCSRLQYGLGALHGYAWIRYSGVVIGRGRSRVERAVVSALAVVGILGVVTPWFLTGDVRVHSFAALGVHYRSAVASTAGEVAYAVLVASLLLPTVRYARAWRQGMAHAGPQFAALVLLQLLGVHDTLVEAGVYNAPYLVDVGFIAPVLVVASRTTRRFVEDARALRELRGDLERLVAERTSELGVARDALFRAEKLGALGQFAAGVAHEVNNPAAVIASNLSYLKEQEAAQLSAEGRKAVEEATESIQRLGGIVRQLLDSARLAACGRPPDSVALRPLGEHAASVARARFGRRVLVLNEIPDELFALCQEAVLSQALVNLVVNAVQAVAPERQDGRVTLAAAREGTRVRITVVDDGVGMTPDVLRRAFEPFFTTKPFGSGAGLGLAVSRGLIASLGGELSLESEPGRGTRATIELPAAAAPARPAAPPVSAARVKLRLLVVDDDAAVQRALRRYLASHFTVDVAGGVDEGLARLAASPFDVVLSDVMMPDGGGERLYRTLVEREPALADRVVFCTGGAVTDAARAFLRAQPRPVLEKPFDVEALLELVARFEKREASAPSP